MSKREKIKAKIKASPQDVRWIELKKLLKNEGFELRKASGSGRVWKRADDGLTITVHKPHGQSKVDTGAVKEILDLLKIK